MEEKLDLVTPGEILLEEFMRPHNISQGKLAGDLNIPSSRINDIVNGKRVITVDTAVRLSAYFDTSVQFWLNLQNNYDLKRLERDGEFNKILLNIRHNPNITVRS